ncbi:DHA2 family efflux MFS transporter permease subunit [Allostreptomyces psammosilenae]|uniref:EmrB/QacA subfamily drug resistance transporter n=1 Tax=Allostreptomyces psammosilenae TaxID=1892865 RepID=A0A852ZY16_9ACTN|nr:DHA2 family efflux MFS transporter permease subunit [Allostreptomyces psammosilenae]NYI03521.1 EmrB/QacA subfamily drug resistance transporter [Allostreptomyces psammosilenae]
MPSTPDQDAGRLDPALRRLIGVILLGGIMGLLDGTMVAVAVDTLVAEFDTSLSAVGWVSTSYLLALTLAIPVTSWAVDRFGGRRLWLFGLLLFLAGSLASALAWNVGSLVAFRVLQGLGAGVLDPLVLTLLARAAGPRRAGRVMGLMGVVLSLGPVFGPALGGVVLEWLGWRGMFLINLPVGVVAFVLALRVVPADPPGTGTAPSRLDVVGLALLAPGFAAGILALSQAAEHAAFTTWSVLAPLAAGVALLAGYTLRARRHPAPLVDPRLFTRPSFTASVTIMALTGLTMFATLFVLPLYFQQAHGHSALVAGLLVAPFGLGGAVAMPLAGRLSDRLGSRSLARGGALLAVLGALALTQTTARTAEVWTALAALAVGLGLGCVSAPTMGALYRTLPGPLVPQGSSVLYMLNQLGASIGIAVVALIVQTAGADDAVRGFHGVHWFAVGAIAVILAGTTLLPGRPPARPAGGAADSTDDAPGDTADGTADAEAVQRALS